MSEEVILNSGYKYIPNCHERQCDRFYQKKLNKEDENTKCFNVYYYDKFELNGALDYDFEYEYIEDRGHYWYKSYIWGIEKDFPYTIEEIENILIGEKK